MIYIIHDKIFHNNKLCIGGIQTYLYNLAYILASENEVRLCQIGENYAIRNIEGVDVVDVPSKKVCDIVNSQHLDIKKSDIVIWGTDSYSKKGDFISISIQHGVGFDYTNTESVLKKYIMHSPLGHVFKLVQRLKSLYFSTQSNYIVCVDYNYLNWYRTYTRRNTSSKLVTIPNFTEVPNIYTNKVVDENRIKIVFARRFIEKRGVYVFCNAIEKLLSNYDTFEVTFAGDGPLKSYIESRFCNNDRVCITSYEAKDSIEFHSNFDIAVVPTIAGEGTSLSLLEAMAAKCAVVASNVGGMTNIILDGYNGLLIEPDEQSIYDAIESLINDKEMLDYLSENSYKSVDGAFSKARWTSKWKKLIGKVSNENCLQ